MRRFGLAGLVFFAAILAPAAALAAPNVPIVDPSGAFRLDVYPWDGRPCVVRPPVRDKELTAACVASDRDAFAGAMADGALDVIGASVIHFDGWDLRVLGARVNGVAPVDSVYPEDMIAAAKRAIAAGVAPGERLVSDGVDAATAVHWSNGAPYLRAAPSIEAGRPVATIAYVVSTASGVVLLSFRGDAAHAADVAKVADNAIASLAAWRPGGQGPTAKLPTSTSIFLTRLAVRGLWALVIAAAGGGAYAMRRRKREA